MGEQRFATKKAPVCKCGGDVRLSRWDGVLLPRRPDLGEKKVWVCLGCGARVGCHRLTDKPLGELADAATRQARSRAHRAFDAIWQTGEITRPQAYAWLAANMGLDRDACHIACFDVRQCDLAESLAKEWTRQREAARCCGPVGR